MSVAFDAISRDTAYSTATRTISHTPVGTPAGVLVWYWQTVATVDEVSGVTYGGVAMTRIFRAYSTAQGEITCYFLQDPPAGTQNATVTRSGSTGYAMIYVQTVTASAGKKVSVEGFATLVDDYGAANPSVTITTRAGIETYVAAGIFSGIDDPTTLTAGSGFAKIGTDWDAGSEICVLEDINTNDAGSNVVAGFTAASNAMAMGAIALREISLGVYTKVLKDNFNRANEDPATGWTDFEGLGLAIVSNRLVGSGSGGGAYWAADTVLTDFEFYFTYAAAVTGSDYLAWRNDAAGGGGYDILYGNGNVLDNGVLVGDFGSTLFQAGDEVCVQHIGQALEIFRKPSGGFWESLVAITTTGRTSGRIQTQLYGTCAYDEFSIGNLSLDNCLPDADVTTTGWTTTPLFSKVNDASDATVIQATAV